MLKNMKMAGKLIVGFGTIVWRSGQQPTQTIKLSKSFRRKLCLQRQPSINI